ncbi:MAG: hypothetical protein NZ730_09690 [Porticoccaceae bacterium]|nr:hypothetical protein [Porticoccaceae bacterium]
MAIDLGLTDAQLKALADELDIDYGYVPGQDDVGLPEDYFDIPTYDVTQPITEVTEEGILGGQAGGLLDRAAQLYSPQYQALRAVQGYFDEKYEAGTPTETIKTISNWWDDVELPEWMTGLAAQNVPTGSGLLGESLDEGSYTDMGSYSYGTIDGIGVEDPN